MISYTIQKLSSLFVLALFVAGVVALSPMRATAQDDPPGRVARLNYIQGSVAYQVSGDQDWVQADPNRPLTAGDNLWVDKNSRGEVHIGSTAIRMSSETGISFLTLDDNTVQLQLAQGAIEVHVRDVSSDNALEIDTPNLAFTIDSGGEYRIQTDPNGGSSIITVRQGQGEVTGGGDSWNLRDGQQYTFNGTDQLSYDASQAPGYDDFENWCQSRNQRENASQSAKYVSRDTDGYYDLDEYGDWHTDPDYGAVWVPRGVEAGWAPYHTGHWVFVAPWGWTWVDAEPWGFAPFHYGRWAFVGGYWGWVPGPVAVRAVYAPALVGFVGGGGFGVSVAFGGGASGVAWFPLGPRDVFVPGYHCSPRYVQNVNITNTRVINVTQVTTVYNNVYVNHNSTVINNYTYARNDRAVTAVSRDTFVNARPVVGATMRVSAQQIQGARVVETSPIAPTRSSYVSSTAHVSTNRPAVPFAQRSVVARLKPTVSRPDVKPSSNRNGQFGQGQTNQQNNSRGNNNLNNGQPAARGNNPPPANNGVNGQPPARGNNPPPANNGVNGQPPVRGNNPPPANNGVNGQPPVRGNNPPPVNNGNNGQPPVRGNNPPPVNNGVNGQPPARGTNPPPVNNGVNGQPRVRGNNPPPVNNGNNGPPPVRGNNPPPVNNGTNGQPPARGHNPPPANSNGNPPQNQQQSRDGFHPFQPPAGATNNNNNPNKNGNNGAGNNTNNGQNVNGNQNDNRNRGSQTPNRNDQTTQGDQRPPARTTPPVKTQDENSNVRPSPNQHQAPPQAKQEQKQEQKQQKDNKKEDDKKKDDQK